MKANRRTINPLDPLVLEAQALSKGGIASAYIERSTGYSSGQISYRVKLLLAVEKPGWKQPGISYRRAWALGITREAQDWIRRIAPKIEREISRTMESAFEHPTPKIIEMRELQRQNKRRAA